MASGGVRVYHAFVRTGSPKKLSSSRSGPQLMETSYHSAIIDVPHDGFNKWDTLAGSTLSAGADLREKRANIVLVRLLEPAENQNIEEGLVLSASNKIYSAFVGTTL